MPTQAVSISCHLVLFCLRRNYAYSPIIGRLFRLFPVLDLLSRLILYQLWLCRNVRTLVTRQLLLRVSHALMIEREGRCRWLTLFLEADALHILDCVDLLGRVLLVAALVLA